MKDNLKYLDIDVLYRKPENVRLPEWFRYYKEEEMERVRTKLNEYGASLCRQRGFETVRANRKKIEKRIDSLLTEIKERYRSEDDNIPIVKVNELQHCSEYMRCNVDVEELQSYDRLIPEITCEVMQKASEYARAVVNSFVEFR